MLYLLFFIFTVFFTFNSVSQDVIYTKDSIEIESKVIEITPDFIKYKKYNQLDGPLRNIEISEVARIKYDDGTEEVFNSDSTGQDTSEIDKEIVSNEKGEKMTDTLKKNNLGINILDERKNSSSVGELHSRAILITGTKHKNKDDAMIAEIKDLFKKRLEKKGFQISEDEEKKPYNMKIAIKNIYYSMQDKFFYMEISQVCSVEVEIEDKQENSLLYSNEFTSRHKSKANKLRDYVKSYGYKATVFNKFEGASIFLYVINDVIEQLINDKNFNQIIYN